MPELLPEVLPEFLPERPSIPAKLFIKLIYQAGA
jgi:hypothetical protein